MIDLIRWSLRNRAIVLAFAAAFLLWGGYAIAKCRWTCSPISAAPTVTILVEGPGMIPTEMESLVTFPIESALNGAAGVRRVRSATAVGVAVVWVEFDWGQDIQRARQIVTEKLTTVSGSLPQGVETPYLAPVSSIMGEILFIALESAKHSPLETADRRRNRGAPAPACRPRCLAGDRDRAAGRSSTRCWSNAQRLRSYNVTPGRRRNRAEAGNRNSSAGFMVAGGQEYLIQGVGRVKTEDDIGSVVDHQRRDQTRAGPRRRRSAHRTRR